MLSALNVGARNYWAPPIRITTADRAKQEIVMRSTSPVGASDTDVTTYESRFRSAATRARKSSDYVERCLSYARPLLSKGLPVIFDEYHLAALVGYSVDYVKAGAYGADAFYRHFAVPKASGGLREIDEPLPSLKEIQRWLLDSVLSKVPVSRFAKGFIDGRSIKDNARFHRGQRYVLSLDVQDFFPSIRRTRVYGAFRSLGYSQTLCNLMARLCTLRGVLPQGAPTSPALSNIVSRDLDARLAGFAAKRRIRYTRYADDITFSGDFDVAKIIHFARAVLAAEGFSLNEAKTRLMEQHQRQEVTGIVVNRALKAPRDLRRQLRQDVHYIDKFGLDSHLARTKEARANTVRHLLGIANFILFVDPQDRHAREAYQYLHELLAEQQPSSKDETE